MALNEYDELLEQQASTENGGNPYQATLDMADRNQQIAVRQSMNVAAEKQPDQHADVMKLSDRFKLAPELVERNYDTLKKKRDAELVDPARIVRDHRGLSEWLADPNNAAVAKDDLQNLTETADTLKDHGIFDTIFQGLKVGTANAASSTARIPSASLNALVLPQNMMAKKIEDLNNSFAQGQPTNTIPIDMNNRDIQITGEPADLSNLKPINQANPQSWDGRLAAPEWLRNNPVANFFDFAAQEESKKLPELNDSVIEKVQAGDWKAASRAAAAQLASNAPQMAQTIALAMAGMPTAAAGLGGAQSMAQSQQDSIEKGLDPVQSTANSIANGAAEFLGEKLVTVPGLSRWEKAIEKSFGKDTARKIMVDTFKTIGASFLQEGAEEGVTQIAQDYSDYHFGANPDLTMEQGLKNAANAFIIGGLMGGTTTSFMAAGHGVHRAGEMRVAERSKELLTAIKDNAVDSKLRKRAPEAYQKALDNMAAGTSVENILLPADAVETYFQAKGLDAAAEAQKLGFGSEFNSAKENGGDISVPLGQFIDKTAETEHFQGLVDNSKFRPEDLTPNEAKQESAKTKADLKLLSSPESEVDTKPVAELSPEEADLKSAREVVADVKSQLLAMDNPLIGPREAEQNAILHGQFMLSMASRTGRSPMEIYQRYGLKIQTREGTVTIAPQDGTTLAAQSVESADPAKAGETFHAEAANDVAAVYNQSDVVKSSTGTSKAEAPVYGEFKVPGGVKSVRVAQVQREAISFDDAKKAVLGDAESVTVKAANGSAITLNERTFGKTKSEIFGQQSQRAQTLTADERNAAVVIAKNLPTLIPNMIYDGREENRKQGAKPGVAAYKRYYGQVEIAGVPYVFQLKSELNKKANGQAAYEGAYVTYARKLETPALSTEVDSGEGSKIDSSIEAKTPFPSRAEVSIGDFAKNINSVRASDRFFQSDDAKDQARGQLVIRSNKQMEIDLFKKHANLSTFLHESGHFYLEVLQDLSKDPKASQQLKDDYQTVLDWMGVKPGEKVESVHHEQWARAFEMYLARGEAPTVELKNAFAHFKVWLMRIYKNLARLNVDLSDDVTGVMNRLLATDEQLADAVRDQQQPMFNDPLTAGMNAATAKKYTEAVSAAKQEAEEELTRKIVAHEMRKRQAEYKEKRAEVQASVDAAANDQQIFKTLAMLQRGTLADGSALPSGTSAIKLDRKSIVDAYGKEFLDKLPRPYVYAKEGGVHFDLAAEMMGYESGDAMLTALANSTSKKAFVEKQTDERMNQIYPDEVMNALPAEAIKAVHSESRAKLLRMELEHLASNNLPVLKDAIRRVARRVPTEADVRAQATKTVSELKLGDIKPYQYQRAEVKAAREAGQLLAKGDINGAFEAKRRELLNYELFRAANDAIETMDKADTLFKRLRAKDEDIAKTRDTDLVNVARAILAEHGLGKADKTAAEFLDKMKRYDQENYQAAVAIMENSGLKPAPYKEIPFNDFVAMHDTVKALWELAKQSREILVDGKRVDRETIKHDLIAQIASIAVPKEKAEYDRASTKWEQTKMGLLSLKAALTRPEHWATAMDRGNRNGAFTRYLINPIRDSITQYRLAKQSYIKEAKEILDPIKKGLGTPRVIQAPEIGYQFKSKAELLGAILHTGNQSNLEKLLLGYGWGERLADKSLDSSRWQAFLMRMYKEGTLTKQDYDAVQGVWNLMEKLKPETQKAHKQMYGFYFNEITANEVVTPFGTYAGGYIPAKTDPYRVEDAARRADRHALESADNTFAFPTTGRGATKSRVENYTQPLQLDVRLALQHIDWALRFTFLEPKVKQIGRVVTDPEFRKAMGTIDSELSSSMLVPWLQRVAKQTVMTPSTTRGGRLADSVLSSMRSRASLQMMALNFVNALQNFTGYFPVALRVRKGLLLENQWRFMKGPKEFAESVAAKSAYMSTRMDDQTRILQQDINEILEDPTKWQKGKEWMVKHSQIFQTATQNTIDNVVWSSAYSQGIEQQMNEKEAVRYADALVRETLGSGAAEDISSFEAGSALNRALGMFYGFFNNQANLLGSELAISKELGLQKRAAKAFHAYTLIVMAPAIVGSVISHALGNGLDDDEDGEYIDDLLDILFMSQFKYMTAFVPGGSILNSAINAYNDKAFDDRITVSPIISTAEKIYKAPVSIAKAVQGTGKASTAIKDSFTAIGFITGTPGGAIARPVGYLADVDQGNAKPTGPIDFTRGFVTGKPGPKK